MAREIRKAQTRKIYKNKRIILFDIEAKQNIAYGTRYSGTRYRSSVQTYGYMLNFVDLIDNSNQIYFLFYITSDVLEPNMYKHELLARLKIGYVSITLLSDNFEYQLPVTDNKDNLYKYTISNLDSKEYDNIISFIVNIIPDDMQFIRALFDDKNPEVRLHLEY